MVGWIFAAFLRDEHLITAVQNRKLMKKKVDASFVGQSIESLLWNGPDQTKRMSEPQLSWWLVGNERATHRVGRVLGFFSSRRNWDSPTPHPQASVPPTLWFRGEGHTRWWERGRESFNSNEETYTVVLYIYVCTLWSNPSQETEDKTKTARQRKNIKLSTTGSVCVLDKRTCGREDATGWENLVFVVFPHGLFAKK